ncbi:hypothetical protein EJ08DRAFT_700565 [Tothia fuscella]|uniref:Uncharacterized protein n=1 Tax=Tothia fuscella TaxID=1048955 RepID=A0A9P4NJX1_9PEZI|nr:hypothetical protein EJ08DRAFT_700565 [Tothia fuscella]
MVCQNVGSTNPDISGIGIMISFAIQAFIAIVLSMWSFHILRQVNDSTAPLDPTRVFILRARRIFLNKILLLSSDIQTLNGLALLISGLCQNATLDLYHFRIIYDLVAFTGFANCAAIVPSLGVANEHRNLRCWVVFMFMLVLIAYTVVFGVRLHSWSDNQTGHCFVIPAHFLWTIAPHPKFEYIYLSCTCTVLLIFLALACWPRKARKVVSGSIPSAIVRRDFSRFRILRFASCFRLLRPAICFFTVIANEWEKDIEHRHMLIGLYDFLAYPVQLYYIFSLRNANEHLLHGDSENRWAFGQVVAVILLMTVVFESLRNYKEYREEVEAHILQTQAVGEDFDMYSTRGGVGDSRLWWR